MKNLHSANKVLYMVKICIFVCTDLKSFMCLCETINPRMFPTTNLSIHFYFSKRNWLYSEEIMESLLKIKACVLFVSLFKFKL